MKRLLILLLPLFFSCTPETPSKVFSKTGNIYIRYTNGKINQLTNTKMDREPVLSPNKKHVAFIRKTNGTEIETGGGSGENNEIWLYDIDADKGKAIVRCIQTDSMETILANLMDISFNSTGQYIYFMSDAWATSASIHRYNISREKEEFISDGNSLLVIPDGKYKDDLIVNKHKYYHSDDGGSYDYFWLLDPSGKELREIGDEEEGAVTKFLAQDNK